jgi:hypothetical protein
MQIARPVLFESYFRASVIKSENQPGRLPHLFLNSEIIFEIPG